MSQSAVARFSPYAIWAGIRSGQDELPFLAAVAAACAAYFAEVYWLTALGLGIFAFCFVWYIEALGKEIAIVPVMSLVAAAQWILGPFIAYYYEGITIKYYMYVDEQTYMSFVVPAVFAFVLSMRLLAPAVRCDALRNYLVRFQPLPQSTVLLVIFGAFAAGFVGPYAPASLAFVFFLLEQLKFIGVIYMLVYRHPYRWWALAIVFFMQLNSAASSGLFHELILWSALILSFVCFDLRVGRFAKFAGLIIGIFALIQVQQIKASYREEIKINPETAGVVALINSITSTVEDSADAPARTSFGLLNARLNQGWIISAIMNYVPEVVEHERGATVSTAIKNTLLPRFIVEKKAVNMSETFMDYTGLSVADGTTFGISILGESWVNFGYYGIVFMAVWGAFLSLMLRIIIRISARHPTFVLWTPLMLLQAVKAETEIVIVLNHVVKSLVFTLAFYFGVRNFTQFKI